MVTVVPSRRGRSNVLPAGTVNALMTTVLHFTAAETSSREAMVPVQALAAGAAAMKGTNARSATK